MVKRLFAIVLISLAMIPFTAPFAAYDEGNQFDASSFAIWDEAGPTSIDVDSLARVDVVFPNLRTGCPVIVSVPPVCAVALVTADPLRPLTLNTSGTFFALSRTLRI